MAGKSVRKNISQIARDKNKTNLDFVIKRLIENHLIGSTLIEGSTFTELEAKLVLEGNSVCGHVIDEHLELLNGRDAASFIHRVFFEERLINVATLDKAHAILFKQVGSATEKTPGRNRAATKLAAFTVLLDKGAPRRFEYENVIKLKTNLPAFVEYHLNRKLPVDKNLSLLRLAQLYFHFEMLHPYPDGNGRIGRFLVSAKAAAEKQWFFRFNLSDGPQHLRIMMDATLKYSESRQEPELCELADFIKDRLEAL